MPNVGLYVAASMLHISFARPVALYVIFLEAIRSGLSCEVSMSSPWKMLLQKGPLSFYTASFYSSSFRPTLFFITSLLLSRTASSPLPNIAAHNGLSSTKFFAIKQTYYVRVAAVTAAAVSMASSLVVFYWFCRMEKRFRHRLIMLLIYGDITKATWLFLYAAVSIARGTVFTESAFCQASGFFLQYGTETSDFAVLVIALHSALQVFRVSSSLRSDGLYPYRYFVYAGALVIPAISASLAFINPHWGYMSQGAFCTLPLRPFWYRLALSWIPRYMIAITIFSLAVGIYAHVGFEFRSMIQMVSNTKPPMSMTTPTGLSAQERELREGEANPESTGHCASSRHRGSSAVSYFLPSPRASAGVSPGSVRDCADVPNHCVAESSHLDRNCTPSVPAIQTHDEAKPEEATLSTPVSDGPNGNASALSRCPITQAQQQFSQHKLRIHRHLRLMFIYPIVYVLMWIIPFINHCMTYTDKWAAHPMFWVSVLTPVCVTLMGAVDCLVFSLRERPWRHIAQSDGSFLGSFAWWRTFPPNANGTLLGGRTRPSATTQQAFMTANPDTPRARMLSETSWMSGAQRAGRSVRMSGSSDRERDQAQSARSRLGYEMEDRRVAKMDKEGKRDFSVPGLPVIESTGDKSDEVGFGSSVERIGRGASVERFGADAELALDGAETGGEREDGEKRRSDDGGVGPVDQRSG